MLAADRRHPRLGIEPLEDRCTPATLSVSDVTVTEGTSGVQYAAVQVTLSEPLKKPVTVNYGTSNGSATAGSDYAAASGKLSFAKNETSKTILVPVYGDQVPEFDETFSVRLSNPKGATIADGVGVVTIADNSPRLSISSEFESEGGVMTFTVSLSAPLGTAFTVDFTTVDSYAVAGEDYVATSGTLTFAPGETTKTFTVQILADGLEEFDEDFYVSLSNPSAPVFITGDGLGFIYGEYGPPN
jgi:Calx-beta domain